MPRDMTPMATIEPYETKAGKRYRVRYRTPGRGQTDKRGFKTKREAEAFAATVEVSKMRGEYVAPSHARLTVGELGQAWLDRQRGHLKPSGYAPMETTWRLRVKPRWGNVALGDIRPTAVQQWISDLGRGKDDAKPVGASVVKRTHYVLSGILADAVRDRLIVVNPAAGIKLPRTTRKRPVYLTHEQVNTLARGAGNKYEGLVLTLAYTGLRWGEVVGLRVRDLDMLRKRATISENAVQSGKQIYIGTPKAHKQRTVPLPEFLLPYLAHPVPGEESRRPSVVQRARWALEASTPDVGLVRQSRPRIRRAAHHAARPAAHCRQPRRQCRGQRQGCAEDAWSCLGGHDARHLRRPFRRRSRGSCDRVGSRSLSRKCGQNVGTRWANGGPAERQIGRCPTTLTDN